MKRLGTVVAKKGVASLYVVIFTTILFGVITLSFIRIILSESVQSNKDDLSQSAYDSALAGVEDAKIAVNKYYNCLTNPSGSDCAKYTASNLFGGNCESFYLKNKILGITEAEVKIQESTASGLDYENNTDQAYTCVIINNVVPDYRSTLTSDTRTRIIPLGISSGKLDKIKRIEFRWYSEINGTTFSNLYPASDSRTDSLAKKSDTSVPPVVSVTLLRTGSSINLNSYNTAETPDYSTMILRPVDGGSVVTTTTIGKSAIEAAGNASSDNSLFQVNCYHNEFACTVNLGDGTDTLFSSDGNAFLIVSLPYGETITDFVVTLYEDAGVDKSIDFENVQISVDSTGRANQLLRRVETRLDPSDSFFPYPDYELTLSGNSDDSFLKNFWITNNCWTEKDVCPNNGQM